MKCGAYCDYIHYDNDDWRTGEKRSIHGDLMQGLPSVLEGVWDGEIVQKCTLMICMVDITRCPLTLILTKTPIIQSNMES